MLKFGNRELRNIQEQVLENMRKIASIEEGSITIAEWGIHINWVFDTEEEFEEYFEEHGTEDLERGDAALIGIEGSEESFDVRVWTAIEGEEDRFIDLGQFPKPGPKGEKGEQGEKGDTGNTGATGAPGRDAHTRQASVNYIASDAVYDIDDLVERTINVGDTVLFQNSYMGACTEVTTTTFRISLPATLIIARPLTFMENLPEAPSNGGLLMAAAPRAADYTLRAISVEGDLWEIPQGGGGEITPEALMDNMEGSDTVVVDINEAGTKVQISLDQDVIDEIDSKQDEITSANKLSADLVVATNTQSVQANLERIDLEVEGLTDDIGDLQTGKLNASKAAVSAVGGLVIPTDTPISEELVGIDTSGDQERVTIGSNLTLVNGVLSASGGSSVEIDNKTIVENEDGEIQVAEGGSGWEETETINITNAVRLVGTSSDYDLVDSEYAQQIYDAAVAGQRYEFVLHGSNGLDTDFTDYECYLEGTKDSSQFGGFGQLHVFDSLYNEYTMEFYVNLNTHNIHVYNGGHSNILPNVPGAYLYISNDDLFTKSYSYQKEIIHKINEKYYERKPKLRKQKNQLNYNNSGIAYFEEDGNYTSGLQLRWDNSEGGPISIDNNIQGEGDNNAYIKYKFNYDRSKLKVTNVSGDNTLTTAIDAEIDTNFLVDDFPWREDTYNTNDADVEITNPSDKLKEILNFTEYLYTSCDNVNYYASPTDISSLFIWGRQGLSLDIIEYDDWNQYQIYLPNLYIIKRVYKDGVTPDKYYYKCNMDMYGIENAYCNWVEGIKVPMSPEFVPLADTSGKGAVPAIPSSTGTYVLKCVDGVMTWVAEE